MRGLHAALFASLFTLGLIGACGVPTAGEPPVDDGEGGPSDPGFFPTGDGGGGGDAIAQPIVIEPVDPVVTHTSGQPAPTITFVAKTLQGQIVPASFTIDRGEIGNVGLSTGVFVASGNVGGKAKITAAWNGTQAATNVTVKLVVTENGASSSGAHGGGAGGQGGVGGEGPGGAADPTTLAVLKGTPVADPGLEMLYPYDGTVWPRGLLAPLLQWRPGAQGDYDAVLIRIEEASFQYEGAFTKTATPFLHHPITQNAWKQMAQSNEGEDVKVTLVFAKGGVAYGPLTRTWKVASGPLKGTVYYNSYGTKLALNYPGAKPNGGMFGGATLAIRGSSTDPVLVAGGDGDSSYCRVCHSVAANGSALITQRGLGGERKFSRYDLKTGAETTMAPEGGGAGGQAKYAWPAIYPDGSMFLGDSSSADGSTNTPNVLYQMVSGMGPATPAVVPTTGWPADLRAAFPAFSPDGKLLAFTVFGNSFATRRTLAMMTFDKATSTWGAKQDLFTPSDPNHTALYPAFLPTNDAIVFEVETRYNGRDYGGTRSDADVEPPDPRADTGARGELWWVKPGVANSAVPLAKLNGTGYLPTGPNGHDDDATLNYEPTVNPVPSGGYAWVVFTSRRLYGNVATINPFHSDPRFHDLTSTPTPKKLWVAAIDLNAPAGTDPSHPAFYLPAQELLAGNSRGYWVVDPCKSDGNPCETGDECCGGYCRPDPTGKLVCSNVVPACAQEYETCTSDVSCCNAPALKCVNGRCAVPGPR